jgi:hypothetical protein
MDFFNMSLHHLRIEQAVTGDLLRGLSVGKRYAPDGSAALYAKDDDVGNPAVGA